MLKIASLFASFLISCGSSIKERIPYGNGITVEALDHSAWDYLLKKHVDSEGNVNYKNFGKDIEPLENYLNYLSKNIPSKTAVKEEQLAYYINVYNAGTVKLIIENYPLKSIKDIRNPWDRKIISLGDVLISLGDVEHEILRKMKEPRIHFAINCASYSCPKLLNEAYTADQLERQLQAATIRFINDPKQNRISKNKAEVSQIFNWFKKDFTVDGSLISYLNQFAKEPFHKTGKITYLTYDWSLNDSK